MANELLKKVHGYILELFKNKLPENFIYHNYNHTAEVVKYAKLIAKKTDLNNDDTEIVLIAAWFHDSGYTETYKGHEEVSTRLAEEFLKKNGYPQDKIEKVKKTIAATHYPVDPKNKLEEVICDADMGHIGCKDYPDRTEILRMEWEKVLGKKVSDEEWLKTEIDFITSHNFFTNFAKKEWEGIKMMHLIKLRKRYRKKISELKNDEKRSEKLSIEKQKLENKKVESTKAIRGIETMFRNTVRTHVEFSAMADNKANIMITINALLIGFLFSGAINEMLGHPYFVYPLSALLTVNIVTIILGIIVVSPKITEGKFTKEDIQKKKTNLLFFGNFYNMPLNDFHWGMAEMMNDRTYLYDSMIKDFYFLGAVLGKKYKYLSYCYKFFMYGMTIAVIAFLVAMVISKSMGLPVLDLPGN
jgi:predicted metal-dependent HD superfamily phosphohydrolase